MGRAERPVDPGAGPLERFAWDLRQLREAAGRPSYRVLAGRAHYSASMLSEAAAGLAVPSLAVTRAYAQACGGDVAEWERRWHRLRAELASRAAEETGLAGPGGPPPYLGLATFQAGDAARFFGRGDLTTELVKRMGETRLLAVVGASGSGKSSLLRAGLLPALTGPAELFTPSAQPLRQLRAAVARAGRRRALAEPMGDLAEPVGDLAEPVGVDRFIDCLLAIAADDSARTRVLLGVRADFYAHCARHAGLVSALRDGQLLVGPMGEQELREVILGPAQHVGCRVEPALVEAILADTAGQPGALPLVSHALLETWERRQGRWLTLAGYRAAGGVADAVARIAERVYAELDPQQRQILHDLFLRLTVLGEGTEDTRRRVSYGELPEGPAVLEVLDRLATARLVSCDQDDVSVVHEALIRRWPRLRGWLATDREQLAAHRRLTDAATEWEQHDRDDAFLYRGARLAPWDGQPVDRLNRAEREFLESSLRRDRRELAGRRRRTRWTVGLLSAAVVVVLALGAVSAVQASRASDQRDLALAGELAATSQQ